MYRADPCSASFGGVSPVTYPTLFPLSFVPPSPDRTLLIRSESTYIRCLHAANSNCKAKTISVPHENNIKTSNDVCITQSVHALSRRTRT